MALLARELLEVGLDTPEGLRALAAALRRGDFEGHMCASEMEKAVGEAERIGNRIVAGLIAAALVNGVGQIVANNTGRWRRWRGPLVVAGAGTVGALGTYLARASARGSGRRLRAG